MFVCVRARVCTRARACVWGVGGCSTLAASSLSRGTALKEEQQELKRLVLSYQQVVPPLIWCPLEGTSAPLDGTTQQVVPPLIWCLPRGCTTKQVVPPSATRTEVPCPLCYQQVVPPSFSPRAPLIPTLLPPLPYSPGPLLLDLGRPLSPSSWITWGWEEGGDYTGGEGGS